MRKSMLSIAIAAASIFPTVAHAQLQTPCASSAVLGNGSIFATRCQIWANDGLNDSQSSVNSWLNTFGAGPLSLVDKDEAPSEADGPFTINQFAVTGTVQFSPAYSGPFVFVLKAGQGLGYFLFNSGSFNTLSYNITGFGNNNSALSHATVYGGSASITQVVPEPASLVLVGAGLLGLAGVARRRKQA